MKKIIVFLALFVAGTAEAQLGRKEVRVLTTTPAVTAGAYSANDVIGGLLTFTNAFPTTAKKGRITSIDIIDDAGQTANYEFCSFKSAPAVIADNAAFAPSEAELITKNPCVAAATTDRFVAGTKSSTSVGSLFSFVASDSTTLYGYLVDRTGRTGASVSDITLIITIEID
jgi:hypothetical protein